MAHQFQVPDATWGDLRIFAIRTRPDGAWEEDWEALRQDARAAAILLDLLSPISYDAYQELLHRYTRPFLREVGLGPKACLAKLAKGDSACFYRATCPGHGAACRAQGTALLPTPPCFEADVADDRARPLVSRVMDLWRLGFYVILVPNERE